MAAGEIDRSRPTQVGRALAHLGVEHIAAYSPVARGRSERMFQSLQDQLVKELALARITTVEVANRFLRETYLPAHNARFAVQAVAAGSGFVAIPGVDLADFLRIQEHRQAGNDNCVSFNRLNSRAAIRGPLRSHFVKARVKVRHYPDGATHSACAVFHGPRCLGRYDKAGTIVDHHHAA